MLSTKMKKHLRRRAERAAAKATVLVGGLLVLLAVAAGTGHATKVITISDEEVRSVAVTSARSLELVFAQAGVPQMRPHDECVVRENEAGKEIEVIRACEVTMTADGQTRSVITTAQTVAELLDEAGITLGEDDLLTPDAQTPVTEEMQVTVQRVWYEEYTVDEAIPMAMEYRPTSLLYREGGEIKQTDGWDGEALVTYRDCYVDGEWQSRTEIDRQVVAEMQPERGIRYEERAPVSRFEGPVIENGSPTEGVAQVFLNQRATGYSARSTARGSAGWGLCYGTVAVNPKVIPYGSLMYIESADGSFVYGYAYAADTGTAMMEDRALVDLFYDTYAESILNAVPSVNVYVLDEETAERYRETNEAILQEEEELHAILRP